MKHLNEILGGIVEYIGDSQDVIEKQSSHIEQMEAERIDHLTKYQEKIAQAVDSMISVGMVCRADKDKALAEFSSDPIKIAEFIAKINTGTNMGEASGDRSNKGLSIAESNFIDFCLQ